jgi:hypothetical protein
MTLLENPAALPRAFLPARVLVERDVGRRLAAIAAATDFSQVAWLDGPVPGLADREGAPRAAAGRVAVREQGDGLAIAIEADSPVLVATSVPDWPGWSARTAAGERLPTATVNHAFVGFSVPAGRHEVRLRYRPPSFVWGLVLGALGLSAGVALRIRGRERREPA